MDPKGQLSVGFYTSLVIFLGVVAYFVLQLFQTIPATTNAIKAESTRIESYQLSQILVDDGGQPLDWQNQAINSVKRIGLLDSAQNKTNLVSSQKISKMNTICSNNFNDVKFLLDIQNEFSISFVNHVTNEKWVCRSGGQLRNSFNVTRIVSIDGTALGEITIEVGEK